MEIKNGFTQFIMLLFFIVFVAGVSMIYIQLHNNNAIQKSRFVNDLNIYFENHRLDSAIENDIYTRKPLLIKNKGRWDDKDINNYLGFFELLGDYQEAGALNERDVFDFYSGYILESYENKDIQQYISDTRKEGKSDEYFIKFEQMAKRYQKLNEPIKK